MLAAEVEIEAGLRDVETAVAAALRPGAMLGGPLSGAALLPGSVRLPGALLLPAALLLPHSRHLLRALGLRLLAGLLDRLRPLLLLLGLLLSPLRLLLLRLLWPLLLLLRRLLSPLRLLLLRLLWPLRRLLSPLLLLLLLRLLGPLLLRLLRLLLLRRLLSPLLLRCASVLPALWPVGFSLLLSLLIALSVNGHRHTEE